MIRRDDTHFDSLIAALTADEKRELIAQLTESLLAETADHGQAAPTISHEKWMTKLREWASRHPQTEYLDDSRESIYIDRG